MSTTPNLLISHIAAAQNQKEVTANAGLDQLDEAMNSAVSIGLSGATYSLNQSDALFNVFFAFTGALTGDNTITLPANKKIYVVVNSTSGGHNLIFKAGAGAQTVTIGDANPHLIYCDGTNKVYSLGVIKAADLADGRFITDIVIAVHTKQLLGRNAAGDTDIPVIKINADNSIGLDPSGYDVRLGGNLILQNNNGFSGRNAANTGDIRLARVNPSDQVELAGGGNDLITGGGYFVGPKLDTPTLKSYTVIGLPGGAEGQLAYASNGRKVGEGPGSGTGVPVYFSAGSWRVLSTDLAVAS